MKRIRRSMLLLVVVVVGLVGPLVLTAPVLADYGCPVEITEGMKAFEDAEGNPIPHPGQWFTATYPLAFCGPSEIHTIWTVEPAPSTFDTCYNAADYLSTQALGVKRCARKVGKVFWLPPGTYTVTACAPPVVDGVCLGSRTEEFVIVD